MKQNIKRQLRDAGFNGKVFFRKAVEFGTPDTHGPAIHRRWLDPEYEVSEIMDSVDRDGFSAVVLYLEPKSYYHYRTILQTPKHVWDEGEINGLRKQLGYCSNWSKTCRDEMIQHLLRDYQFPEFSITKEQTKFGLDWLKRTQFKLNGEIRANAFIGRREAKIIRNFKCFKFVDIHFENWNQYSECYQTTAPCYKVIAKNGETFTYRVSPMGGFAANYEVVA